MEALQQVILALLEENGLQLAILVAAILILGKFGKAQPSPWGFAAILLPIPLLTAGFAWPALRDWLGFYTPLLLLVMMADAFLLSLPARGVHIQRTLPDTFWIAQENRVTLEIHHEGRTPLHLMLADDSPDSFHEPEPMATRLTVAPGEHRLLMRRLVPRDRGQFDYGPLWFRYRSRLGLLWLSGSTETPSRVSVLPDFRRVRQMRVRYSRSLSQGELHQRSLGLEGTRFSGLRNYAHGDDPRKLAWQSTAKLDMPIVRTYEPEVEQPIMILLDAGRRMNGWLPPNPVHPAGIRKFDLAVNTALALASVAMDRGDWAGLGIFSNRVLSHIPAGGRAPHFRLIQKALGESTVEAVEPQYETVLLQFAHSLRRRSLVIVITDLIDPAASRELLSGLRAFSRQHLVILATFRDPAIEALGGGLPTNADEVYVRAVSRDILGQREKTLAVLAHSPALVVVDAPPEGLDDALIQRYLKIKRRGRL